MKLVITEKPSVAKDIARVLKVPNRKDGYFDGNGYRITWAFGHLVQLINPEEYNDAYKKWEMRSLPIMPDQFKRESVPNASSKKQLQLIVSLLKQDQVSEVICATDAGREGELIFRLIYEQAKVDKPISRLWISSQTDKAIKEGFESLKPGTDYDPLYDSALCRAEADWLVGMNATRAYTVRCSNGAGVMSVGRVQTPVLKMIVDRYLENINFKPETFFEIFADARHTNGEYQAKWCLDKEDRLSEKAKAETIMSDLESVKDGVVAKLTQKELKEKPPLLYDLTEIQRDANKKYKFSAEHTLRLMQSLYEKHKVLTYPRTSSRYLSQDIVPKLKGLIANLSDSPEYGEVATQIVQGKIAPGKRVVDDKKVTDHHAIIPTERKANPAVFSADEAKVYDLVIRRFLSVFMPDCQKHHTEIMTQFGAHMFRTTGTVITRPGWREIALSDEIRPKKGTKKKEGESLLPKVAEGDPVSLDGLRLNESKTKPPALYNEASILGAMETCGKQIEDEALREAMKECGLGTPATRAQILERLIKVGYIKREKNRLLPLPKGEFLIANIQDPELVTPELTGQWEKRLNDMAQRQYKRSDYMDQIRIFTQKIIDNIKASKVSARNPNQQSFGTCPLCEGDVVETKLSYGCANWKSHDCTFTIWKTIAQKKISEKQAVQLLKDGKTDVIKGFKNKAGKKFDAALSLADGKVSFLFDAVVGECPLCDGHVVTTPKAYSCSNWRQTQCKLTIWKVIAGKTISETEVKTLIAGEVVAKQSGFKSRAGNDFSAALKLKEGRVEMVFDD